jgi:hypothetical protein
MSCEFLLSLSLSLSLSVGWYYNISMNEAVDNVDCFFWVVDLSEFPSAKLFFFIVFGFLTTKFDFIVDRRKDVGLVLLAHAIVIRHVEHLLELLFRLERCCI